MKNILIFSLLFLVSLSAVYAETIVFEGSPIARNNSSIEETFNEPIEGEAKVNYKLIITRDKNGYVWFSREKKRLDYYKSGIFHYFVNPGGSGYIKIAEAEENKYLYMEHMSLGLATITYWGIGYNIDFKE